MQCLGVYSEGSRGISLHCLLSEVLRGVAGFIYEFLQYLITECNTASIGWKETLAVWEREWDCAGFAEENVVCPDPLILWNKGDNQIGESR